MAGSEFGCIMQFSTILPGDTMARTHYRARFYPPSEVYIVFSYKENATQLRLQPWLLWMICKFGEQGSKTGKKSACTLETELSGQL